MSLNDNECENGTYEPLPLDDGYKESKPKDTNQINKDADKPSEDIYSDLPPLQSPNETMFPSLREDITSSSSPSYDREEEIINRRTDDDISIPPHSSTTNREEGRNNNSNSSDLNIIPHNNLTNNADIDPTITQFFNSTVNPNQPQIKQSITNNTQIHSNRTVSNFRSIQPYGEKKTCYICNIQFDKNSLFIHISRDKYICLRCSVTHVHNIRHLRDWEASLSSRRGKQCYRCKCRKPLARFKQGKNICAYCVLKKKYVYLTKPIRLNNH